MPGAREVREREPAAPGVPEALHEEAARVVTAALLQAGPPQSIAPAAGRLADLRLWLRDTDG